MIHLKNYPPNTIIEIVSLDKLDANYGEKNFIGKKFRHIKNGFLSRKLLGDLRIAEQSKLYYFLGSDCPERYPNFKFKVVTK